MERVAFKMRLLPGNADEYKKRHDEIWPELSALLKQKGISGYSILLDEETNTLTAILSIEDVQMLDTLPQYKIMQKWWAYMADITESNANGVPVIISLKEVFYLP